MDITDFGGSLGFDRKSHHGSDNERGKKVFHDLD
jgi:hypothetical protein